MDIFNKLFKEVIRNNDEKALKELIEMINPWLYRLVFKILKNSLETEDVLQETWIKIWEQRNKFDEVRSFKNWICTIAINRSLKILRKKNVERKTSLDEVDEQSNNLNFNVDNNDETIKILEDAIDEIDERCRILIVLKYYEHLSYEEISALLGYKLNFVRNHLFRCRKKLYHILLKKGFTI